MEVYKIPIETAFIVFPFIAFIITIPFLLYEYRKYGAIPFTKSFIVYSFILYLICAYFLVIFPLPTIDKVKNLKTPTMQLNLFNFISTIRETTNYKINSITNFILFLKQPTVYTVIFNIALTLPFGVYLRYFYKKNMIQTTILTFFLSTFFEVTQLSGLYGIYPRPYRLFDVDDLMINTIGGIIGYFLEPMFSFFLPSSNELEQRSYEKGTKVSIIRRALSFFIDIILFSISRLIMWIILYKTNIQRFYSIISLLIYYIIIPLLTRGQTIGKKILKMTIESSKKNMNLKTYQIFFRYFIFCFIIVYPKIWINLLEINDKYVLKRLWIIIFICQIINIIYYIYNLSKKNNIFLYEKITNTKNKSLINNPALIEEQSKSSNTNN